MVEAARINKSKRVPGDIAVGIDAPSQPDRIRLHVDDPCHASSVVAGVFPRRINSLSGEDEDGTPCSVTNFRRGTFSA